MVTKHGIVALFIFLLCAPTNTLAKSEADSESGFWTYVGYGTAAVVGGAASIVAVPAVLGAAGFTATGIAAGSIAAAGQAAMGPAVAGGGFALLQSIGAGGLGAAGTALVGGVGSLLGISTAAVAHSSVKENKKEE